MLNLVFIISLIVTPLMSIVIGVLAFSKLPTIIAVGFTILVFLLIFFGCQYLISMLKVKIYRPEKSIKFESMILSAIPDKFGMTGICATYVFCLGIFGHIVCISTIIILILTVSGNDPIVILTYEGLILVLSIYVLVRFSKMSPLFAPPLVASRDGIRSQKYFVPWQDVTNVYVGSGRGSPLYVETARGMSSYQVGGDGREVAYEAKCIQLPVLGMWPEDAAQYLLLRAHLTCDAAKLER